MYNQDYLQHYGILGMHWGKRSTSIKDIKGLASKNEKMKAKLESTINKADKNKVKVDKLTAKLQKHGNYKTTIGYTMAKDTGKKLSKKLHIDKKLNKRIDKLKLRLEKNQKLMQTKVTELPKEDVKNGKSIVNSIIN
jgi:phosphate-selective porin